MYDMYPEWGPVPHDPEQPTRLPAGGHRRPHRWVEAPLSAPDLRDRAADRPDDH